MSVSNSSAFMLPKENAATVMARESDFTYHVIPDRRMNLVNAYLIVQYNRIQFSISVVFPNMFSLWAFPYQARFNILLQRLIEQGLTGYFKKRGLRNKGIKDHQLISTKSSTASLNISEITLADLEFMFIVVVIGELTNLTVFVFEVIIGN